jgi:hypothetical protein
MSEDIDYLRREFMKTFDRRQERDIARAKTPKFILQLEAGNE